ncbi:MAG: ferritin-like domain-containing protein [Leptolyngbya sp. SIOISBB]|nr:ferritin-like domain-containing protein [Leptolyngbya sp. SIOISBB]
MTYVLSSHTHTTDLAGEFATELGWWQILQRIRTLRQRYVTEPILRDRLEELPHQLAHPTVRPWGAIAWGDVHADQLIGIDCETFCATLLGTINTEAPIRGYTQSSRQYLERLYPAMARYVGGRVDESNKLVAIGLWEREEKRHTPALAKLYTILSGEKPDIVPHAARPYQPADDPRENLYRHGLHRVATEYGATCLYLWMMAYSTGALQAVLAELLIDEINHMTKFWGFGMWAYPDSSLVKIGQTLSRAMVRKLRDRTSQGSLLHTLRRMMDELAWERWSATQRLTLLYTFDQVIKPICAWNGTLTPTYLDALFGKPDEIGNAT